MPRVAALLDTQQISDVTAIQGEDSTLVPQASLRRTTDKLQRSFDLYTLVMLS